MYCKDKEKYRKLRKTEYVDVCCTHEGRLLTVIICCQVERCSQEYAQSIEVRRQCQQSLRKQNKFEKDSKEVQEEGSKEYCDLLEAYNHCMKALSKSCRGNIEYHTILTLVRHWIQDNNCIRGKRPKNSSLCSFKPVSVTTKTFKKPSSEEKEGGLQVCLQDAFNYSSDVDRFAYLRYQLRSNNKSNYSRWRDTEAATHSRKNARQKQNKARQPRKAFLDEYDIGEEKGNSSLLSVLNAGDDSEEDDDSDLDLRTSQESLTCIMYGDPHLRTFAQNYQTCRCLGAWPLIEHPLFAIQITNSKLIGHNSNDATGMTRVTVLIRQFRSCEIYRSLIYEAEANEHQRASLPTTFTDGSSSTPNNLIRIVPSSQKVVTLHLEHIGVEVHIGDFSDHNYLSVVVKLNSLSIERQKHFVGALSNYSLCKNGCPLHEQIDINTKLKANLSNALTSAPKTARAVNACKGLFGYYRNACLYDVTIKGLIDSDNSCRFGQSFDYFGIIENEMFLDKQFITTNTASERGIEQYIPILVTVFTHLYSLSVHL